MLLCKFCQKECKNENSLRNHERLCRDNPNRQIPSTERGRQSSWKKYSCTHCHEMFSLSNLKKHENSCKQNPDNKKTCPVCDKIFHGNSITCSYSCSNKHFRVGENNGNWKGNNYRLIAEMNHDMKCIVCGEDKILSIHHYDHNHDNNHPSNLIPMCPTHHQYLHSRYSDEVLPIVEKYRKELGFA